MAYQNVGTPRFIIDWLSWWKSLGLLYGGEIWNGEQSSHSTEAEAVNSVIGLNPSSQTVVNAIGDSAEGKGFNYQIGATASFPVHDVNIAGLLGHNFASISEQGVTDFTFSYYNGTDYPWMGLTDDILINASGSGSNIYFQYDGFSLWSVSDSSTTSPVISAASLQPNLRHIPTEFSNSDIKLGSLLLGRYYDMPNAPNLSLTMSREYGGTKEFTTHNGSSMSNTMWSKPPSWGDRGAWELGDSNPKLSRSGRRSWDLKFSYMADSDLWGSNQMVGYYSPNVDTVNQQLGYDEGDVRDEGWEQEFGQEPWYSSSAGFNYNLLTDDNFFSQVWHKTLGGTLPFIFQPDSSNNNPDQFCIARFKNNSLKATQSAFNVYDISLSIEEVW